MKELYVAGRVTDVSDKKRLVWRLLGIFTSEKKAEESCKTKRDFVRQFDVDVPLEEHGSKLQTVWFPLKKKAKQ